MTSPKDPQRRVMLICCSTPSPEIMADGDVSTRVPGPVMMADGYVSTGRPGPLVTSDMDVRSDGQGTSPTPVEDAVMTSVDHHVDSVVTGDGSCLQIIIHRCTVLRAGLAVIEDVSLDDDMSSADSLVQLYVCNQ